MNVLLDVIKIAQDRKYMVLDPIDSSGMDQTDSTKLQMGTIFTFKKKVNTTIFTNDWSNLILNVVSQNLPLYIKGLKQ